jgi:hypothetical protein
MPTDSQINANRRNAQKSTGPRSTEDELIAEYRRDFAPTNAWKKSLIEEIVRARWSLLPRRDSAAPNEPNFEPGAFPTTTCKTITPPPETPHRLGAAALRI